MGQETQQKEPCRCPVRPYYSLGSFGSGSTHETALIKKWEAEHGHHAYAKARDELAKAMQVAETSVKRDEQGGAGRAVLDMVHDVLGAERPGLKT